MTQAQPTMQSALQDAAANIGTQLPECAGFAILAWGGGQTKLQVAPAELPLADLVSILRSTANEIEKRLTVAGLSALQAADAPAVASAAEVSAAPKAEAAPVVNGSAKPKGKRGRPKAAKPAAQQAAVQ